VRLEFAKDVMVQGRSIFLDRPTLGGISRAHLSGDYRWTGSQRLGRDDWVRIAMCRR
jgi:hypothetical protein